MPSLRVARRLHASHYVQVAGQISSLYEGEEDDIAEADRLLAADQPQIAAARRWAAAELGVDADSQLYTAGAIAEIQGLASAGGEGGALTPEQQERLFLQYCAAHLDRLSLNESLATTNRAKRTLRELMSLIQGSGKPPAGVEEEPPAE